MAKANVTLVLTHAVVLGDGDKARTFGAGRTVEVPDELAQQLLAARAAVVAKATKPAPATAPASEG